jgi:23S rRNA (pseudouridine1915-N3)-methyltransferase
MQDMPAIRPHCITSLFSCILRSMQINLISVGNRMPGWVQQGYDEYAKRLPRECELVLKEIAPGKRTKNSDVARIVKEEGERMIAAMPQSTHIVTLDIPGKPWTTPELAQAMQRWLEGGQHVSLLIGGPEGLADSVKQLARESWSLSKLTFPHPLVRIVVAEQIYRAWSILNNHPYHR